MKSFLTVLSAFTMAQTIARVSDPEGGWAVLVLLGLSLFHLSGAMAMATLEQRIIDKGERQ